MIKINAPYPLEHKTSMSAGFDLQSLQTVYLAPGQRALIKTGVTWETDEQVVCLVVPRSGLAAKHGITLLNSPGVVDADYRGEWLCNLINHSDTAVVICEGERIAQGVVMPFLFVGNIVQTERGSGGFGSTG